MDSLPFARGMVMVLGQIAVCSLSFWMPRTTDMQYLNVILLLLFFSFLKHEYIQNKHLLAAQTYPMQSLL